MSFVIVPDSETLQEVNFDALLPRQRRFAEEYIRDLNGQNAAIRAGYSAPTAAQQASRLLNDVNVLALVEKLKAERTERVNVTADNVLHEMSLLANSSLEHYYVDDEGQVKPTPDAPEGAMRAIESIKKKTTIRVGKGEDGEITKTYDVTIKLWDKPTPLKLMGRHVGLFPNKVELTGKNGGPIEHAVRKMTDEELAKEALALAEKASQLEGGE